MNFELKPTHENIVKTINEDILGRNGDLKKFVKILYLVKDMNLISLNGEWGAGKTFFVKQAVEVIKNLNCSEEQIDNELASFIREFKNIQLKEVNTEGELYPIYYNAWEYDSNEDPLLTIIYSILDQNPDAQLIEKNNKSISEKISKILSCFKISASYLNNNGWGAGIEIQYKSEDSNKLTKDVYSVEKAKKTFKLLLEEIRIEKTNKIVLFIDELDRCNPVFAVRLLERIKHFFDEDSFIFVFSTNINELQYTIKRFYGEGINRISVFE